VNHYLYPSTVCTACVTIVFVTSVLAGLAQDNASQWHRVSTEEGSITEVDRSSLVFEQDQVLRAKFRTKLSKSEPMPGNPAVKYRTRLDTIQFSVKDQRYRVSESNLLDSSGKVVFSYSTGDTNGWKEIRGRTAHRLFNAAGQLQPFGVWKVQSYRYASGDPASDKDPLELRSLLGTEILLTLDRVVAGKGTCSSPVFDGQTVTNEEFESRVGSSLQSMSLPSDKIETIRLACRSTNKFPSQTIVLRLPGNKALMLWEGVFLELERTRDLFSP
jgi:hypothetical protein